MLVMEHPGPPDEGRMGHSHTALRTGRVEGTGAPDRGPSLDRNPGPTGGTRREGRDSWGQRRGDSGPPEEGRSEALPS